jgi:hypothetical protein
MDNIFNKKNNYEILRYKGYGNNVYSYLNQCYDYDEGISGNIFFNKYDLLFKELRLIKRQFLNGFIRYVHPNNNIYIYELNKYNWYTLYEYNNMYNNSAIENIENYDIDDIDLYNKILNILLSNNTKKNNIRKNENINPLPNKKIKK